MENLMRSALMATIMASLLAITAFANGVQTPSKEITGAFFGEGGPIYELIFLDFSELNAVLSGVSFTGDFRLGEQSSFFVHGGGGGLDTTDLHFGGRGSSGSWVVPVSGERFNRAELKLSYGGFFFERLLSGHDQSPFLAGLLLGGLDLELQLSQVPPAHFSTAVASPFMAELKRTYFLLEPYVSTEFRLLGFMEIKLEAGYLMAFSTREWCTPLKVLLRGGPLGKLFAPDIGLTVIFGSWTRQGPYP